MAILYFLTVCAVCAKWTIIVEFFGEMGEMNFVYLLKWILIAFKLMSFIKIFSNFMIKE